MRKLKNLLKLVALKFLKKVCPTIFFYSAHTHKTHNGTYVMIAPVTRCRVKHNELHFWNTIYSSKPTGLRNHTQDLFKKTQTAIRLNGEQVERFLLGKKTRVISKMPQIFQIQKSEYERSQCDLKHFSSNALICSTFTL